MATRRRKRRYTKRRVARAPARRRTYKRRRRRNPQTGTRKRVSVYKTKSGYRYPRTRRGTIRKRTVINPRRRRRNPNGGRLTLRKIFNQRLIINSASVAVGFIAGNIGANWVRTQLPAVAAPLGQFGGVVNIGLGLVVSAMAGARQEPMKMIGLGMAASGVYDILKQFLPQFLPGIPLGQVGFNPFTRSHALGPESPLMSSGAALYGADTSLMGADTSLMGHDYGGYYDMDEEAL